jgi:putative hydrolase of the HAD superfamily
MNIKNIVFDVGQVLFEYNPGKIIDTLVPNCQDKESYLETLFFDRFWQDMDRGRFSDSEAKSILEKKSCNDQKKCNELNLIFDRWPYHLDTIPEIKDLFCSLSKSYNVLILSNFQDKPFDKLLEAHPFLKLANGMVVSGKVKYVKPEPEIYTLMLDNHNIKAEETIFIDDREANIVAANKLGINGILFTSPQELMTDLKTFNIEIPTRANAL